MRWTAVVLATSVAVVQLALFGLAQRQLPATMLAAGPIADAPWLRWLWAIGWALPWLAGAVLLARGSARRGAAVLVTAMVLLGVAGLRNVVTVMTLPALTGEVPVSTWLERFGGVLAWLLSLAAGITAFLARPRHAWRVAAPGPVGWYVAIAVIAWLPAAFQQTAFAPPGAPRRYVETEASELAGLEAVSSVASAVVVAALLWVAPRLRPEVAGAVLLTYAVPTLLADLGGILRVVNEEFVIFTPSGAIGLLGVIGLIGTGVRWGSRRVVTPIEPPPPPVLDPPRSQ
jgi:hypothetical protein